MTVDSATDEDTTDSTDDGLGAVEQTAASSRPPTRWSRGRIGYLMAFVVLPMMLVGLTGAAGGLTWSIGAQRGAADVTQMAEQATVAMLSYQPDTVDQQLNGAVDLLTGPFKDSYASLIHDVVIPGAKQKVVSASVSVPAAARVSVDRDHAIVLVFVNQTTTIATSPPTTTESAVRVSMDRVDQRWLVSGFDPI